MSCCDKPGLLPVEDALARLLSLAEQSPILDTETLPLSEVDGRVLAEPLLAGLDLPPWPNSAMDGYAVRAADITAAGVALPVSQRIPAGAAAQPLLL